MAVMTKQDDDNYKMFVSGNQELMQTNADVGESAKKIFENVASTNSSLQDHAEAVRENESIVSSVLKVTESVLGDIESACNEQEIESTNFTEKASKTIEESKTADLADVGETTQVIKDEFEKCSIHLTTCLHEDAQKSVDQLSELTKDAFAFVRKEVIENTKSSVTRDVELPSSDLSTQIRGSIDNVGSHVDAAEEKIQTMGKDHCSLAESMKEHIGSESSQIEQGLIHQKSDIGKHEEALKAALEGYEKNVLGLLSESEKHATEGKEAICGFSQNVIRIDEDTPKVADRKIPIYSEELTSTPSVEMILTHHSMVWSMLQLDTTSMPHTVNQLTSLSSEPVPVG
jgi:hypothetical protein